MIVILTNQFSTRQKPFRLLSTSYLLNMDPFFYTKPTLGFHGFQPNYHYMLKCSNSVRNILVLKFSSFFNADSVFPA